MAVTGSPRLPAACAPSRMHTRALFSLAFLDNRIALSSSGAASVPRNSLVCPMFCHWRSYYVLSLTANINLHFVSVSTALANLLSKEVCRDGLGPTHPRGAFLLETKKLRIALIVPFDKLWLPPNSPVRNPMTAEVTTRPCFPQVSWHDHDMKFKSVNEIWFQRLRLNWIL